MGTIHSLTIRLSERYKENEWMNSVYAFCIENIFIKYGTLRSFLTSLRVVPTSLCGRSNDTLPPKVSSEHVVDAIGTDGNCRQDDPKHPQVREPLFFHEKSFIHVDLTGGLSPCEQES